MVSVKQYIDFNCYSIFIIAFYFYFLLQGLLCSHSGIARHWESLFSLSFLIFETHNNTCGLLRWCNGKESTCECRRCKRHEFDPRVREDPLKEEMATCSRILVWKIPWIEEPGGLYSMGSQRVRHDWMSMHAIIFLNRFLVMFKWDNECSVVLEP